MIRPQDVVVVVKLSVAKRLTYQELATSLGMSLSEVHGAVKRATAAGLLGPDRRPHRAAVLEFLLHGVKYVFVPKRGQLTRGMPTAHGAPPLDKILGTGLGPPPVWPDPQGTMRGESFEPLYSSVPKAARKDPRLYEALCLIDAIRGGRPRDAPTAEAYLREVFSLAGGARGKRAKSFSLSDPRRDRIRRRLAQIGPGPAGFYASAVELLALETPLEATSHLVWHLARDIESALRQVFGELIQQPPSTSKKCPACGKDLEQGRHRQAIDSIVTAYDLSSDASQDWLTLAGMGKEKGLQARAHRRDLSSPRPIDRDFWEKFEGWLDGVLDGLERSYSMVFERVDKLAGSNPSTANAKILRGQIPQNHDVATQFFRRIDDPAWIGPLEEAGFFGTPPSPIPQEEGFSYPSWPALDYLARMTSRAPEDVARVALAIPASENFRVYEVLAQIATALPTALAAPFTDRLEGWLAENTIELVSYGLLGTIATLVERLAAGGEVAAAIRALGTLLRPSASPEAPDPSSLLREVRSRVPRGELPWLMDRLSPTISKLGESVHELFSSLLVEALLITRNVDAVDSDGVDDEWDDWSWIWREAIEDHPRNGNNGLLTILVSAVRNSAFRLIEMEPTRLAEVVEGFEAHRWSIFRRLALHLLVHFDSPDSALLVPRILDRRAFDERHSSHEHARLLRKFFRRLGEAQQQEILSWIDETSSDVQKIAWLKVIADDVPERWRLRLDTLIQVHGDRPAVDELPAPTPIYAGPTSPVDHDALVQMSPEALVDFVVSWIPSSTFGAPEPTGLSRAIQSVVERRPDSYAANARLLERLDPTYLRGALDGFASAALAERPFEWVPVIDLCAFATARPRRIAGRKPTMMGLDANWGGARASVLHLLSEGLTNNRAPIPAEARERVWSALRPVLDDPDGGPPRRRIPAAADPMESSINSVRGNAVRSAIDYVAWVAQRKTLQGMPAEVREELDRQLAHPSTAILSAFGERISQLAALDEAWCTENMSRIFFSGADGRDPAWETYLRYGHLDLRTFRVLRGHYVLAVADLAVADRRLARRIAVHLASLHWYGHLDFQDDDGLLDNFFAGAPPSVAGHALEHLGRWLHEETPPTSEALMRLKLLWDKRSKVGRREELEAFGWWFSSGRFEDEWALGQLREVLAAKVLPRASERVAERLANLVPRHLPAVLAMLDLLLQANDQGWGLFGWRGPARAILAAGKASINEADQHLAAQIANRLCSPAYGYSEFRSLLPVERPRAR